MTDFGAQCGAYEEILEIEVTDFGAWLDLEDFGATDFAWGAERCSEEPQWSRPPPENTQAVEREQHSRNSIHDVNSDFKHLRSQEKPWSPPAAIEDTVQRLIACENWQFSYC